MRSEGIEEKIDRLKIEIANHHRDWFGMVGTCWEREDWRRKQARLAQYQELWAKEEQARRRICAPKEEMQ